MRPVLETKLAGIAALPVRAVGVFLDGLVIGSVAQAVAHFVRPRWVGTVIGVVLICLYTVPQIAIWGMTVGSRCAGVQVASNRGEPPGWTRSFIRWGSVALVGQLLVVVVPGGPTRRLVAVSVLLAALFLPALVDSRRRALHDRAAGTIVYYRYRTGGQP